MAHNINKKVVLMTLVVGLAFLLHGPTVTAGLCGMSNEGLQACRPAVVTENATPPSEKCCEALKDADFPCFCVLKKYSKPPIKGIDFKKALDLPAACGINSVNCN